MLNYLLHSSLLVAISFLVYRIFLTKETFYGWNRYAILIMIALSAILPLIEIPQEWSFRGSAGNLVELVALNEFHSENFQPKEEKQKSEKLKKKKNDPLIENQPKFAFTDAVYWLYLSGVVIFALALVVQFVQLRIKSQRLERFRDGQYWVYELQGKDPPFSFFYNIYVNPSLYEHNIFEQILSHEKLHIENKHFIDKLLAEVLVICFWFNPFAWLLRKEISNNLEFQTDDQMLSADADQEEYQISLLKVSVHSHPLSFTTNYNQTMLEKRIRMMNTKKSSMKSSWKYLMILPLFALSLFSFNRTDRHLEGNTALQDDTNSQYDHIEEITMETTFGSKSNDNTFILANVTGKVTIVGHDKEIIDIHILKKISAPLEAQMEKGVEEIKVGNQRGPNNFALFLDSPYSNFNMDENTLSYTENCGGEPCFDYNFRLDYTIKLPKNANLIVQNINGGDIKVENLFSNELRIKHVTGSIELKNVTGTTQAETISGNILGRYSEVPTGDSSFKTISGFIEASYPKDFSGKVFQKAGDGIFKSDFEIDEKYTKNNKIKSSFAIGSGLSTFRFETTSGNIQLQSN